MKLKSWSQSQKPQDPRALAPGRLDERGKDLTTRQFAALLAEPTAFVIGGADGWMPQ
jgi:23S rRNA pseudoU1915 N3-methylase RlmH